MVPIDRVPRFAMVFSLAAILFPGGAAHAFSIDLDDIVGEIGNIGEQIIQLPNPIITPIQIITGNQNPLDVNEYVRQQGEAISAITNSTRNLTNIPYDAAGQLISNVGGDDARIAFEIVTGGERLQSEFIFTSTQQVATMLQGQDPLISIAMPLAAAIRDAHSKFDAQAQPFPQDVKIILGQVIPRDILERARYTVGDIKISLPTAITSGGAFLGLFSRRFSGEIAVTLDDIIVFPREVNFSDLDDLEWISHEIFHVKQYRDWGIDQFSFNYLKNKQAVEDQAEAAGSYARSFLSQISNNQTIDPKITHSSSSAYATKIVQTPLGQTTVMVELTEAQSTPGTPNNGGILQPVFNNSIEMDFAGYCVLNGEKLYITRDETIIAPMRGFMPFGRRFKPGLNPSCYFDLQFPSARACAHEVTSIDPINGDVLYGYEVYFGNIHAGRCVSCTPELCSG